MGRARSGAHPSNELYVILWNHFSATRIWVTEGLRPAGERARAIRQEYDTMSGAGVKPSTVAHDPEILEPGVAAESTTNSEELAAVREWQAERLRLVWDSRRSFLRAAAIGLLASTLVAFLIPKRFSATTQLMPP